MRTVPTDCCQLGDGAVRLGVRSFLPRQGGLVLIGPLHQLAQSARVQTRFALTVTKLSAFLSTRHKSTDAIPECQYVSILFEGNRGLPASSSKGIPGDCARRHSYARRSKVRQGLPNASECFSSARGIPDRADLRTRQRMGQECGSRWGVPA